MKQLTTKLITNILTLTRNVPSFRILYMLNSCIQYTVNNMMYKIKSINNLFIYLLIEFEKSLGNNSILYTINQGGKA